MTIRDYLKNLGATEMMLSAKVVELMEQKMLFDTDLADLSADTVAKILGDLVKNVGAAATRLESFTVHEKYAADDLERKMAQAQAQSDMLQKIVHEATAGISNIEIHNPDVKDAVVAYAAVLKATREVFGEENMTEDVMAHAVDAGSYIAWRGMTGREETSRTSQQKRW